MAVKRGAGFWSGFTLVIVAGLCILLLTLDLRRVAAPWLGAAIGGTLGRQVSIEGPVHLGLWPGGLKLVAEDVRLANAPWGSQPDMLRIGRLEARGALGPLLLGRFVVEALLVEDADVLLETDYSGLTNRPRPGRLTLQDRVLAHMALEGPHDIVVKSLHLVYQAADGSRPFETTIERAELRPVLEGLKIELLGNYRGSLIALDGTLAEPMALIRGERTRIELAAAIGDTTVLVAGGLGSPWRGPGFDLRLDGKAADLSDLGGLLGLSGFPPQSPLGFTADLKMRENAIDIDQVSATIGSGNLVGEAHLKFDDDGLAELDGVFASEALDLALVGGAWLAPLARMPDLDAPLPLDWLRHVKIDVSYQADTLRYRNLAIGDVDLRLLVADGVMTAYPLSARVEGAPFDIELAADFSLDTPRVELRAATPDLPLETVIAHSGFRPLVAGALDVAVELRGHGTSLGDIFTSLEGNGGAALANGRLEAGYIAKLPEPWRAPLLAMGEGTAPVDLRCAKTQIAFGNGYGTSRMLYADSASSATAGAGTLDLTSGALDVWLVPEPKTPANRKAAKSLSVSGTLGKPRFAVAAPTARAVPRAPSAASCDAGLAGGLVLRLRDPAVIDPKTYDALLARGEDMSKYRVDPGELAKWRAVHGTPPAPDGEDGEENGAGAGGAE